MVEVSRREAVAGAALLALATSAAGAVPPADPRTSALGQIKMEACLDGHPAVWTYGGVIYAIRPSARPLALIAVAGAATSLASPLPDGAWSMRGGTLSFFRDAKTGAFLDTFDNPFTNKRVEVRPNNLTGGSMHFPADGSAPRFIGRSKAGETMPGGFNQSDPNRPLGRVDWVESRDTVMLVTDHAYEVPTQPQTEARTIFADRDAFFDPRVTRLKARLATSTITPYLKWLEMAGEPGHLIWHCSGEKLFDVAELPADFRARAGSLLATLATPPAP